MKSDLENHDLPRFADLDADYEIVRELGRGGTAVVYLARERELGRRVAIKVIRSTYIEDDEAAARLEREARTVASLQHPNIVMLYGTCRLRDHSLALIMQYVPGRTLKSEVRTRGPLPFDRVQQILSDIGGALAHAQRHRIVHRDIKPENIYLDDETGIARLSDFGIARPWDAEQGLTLPGMAIGTPAYMSPEQIEGIVLDGRSDLYSLGLVGFEMLTGRAPWAGETLFGMIYKQKHEILPPLEQLRPGIPPLLSRAIEGALRKNRDERWADADEFLAAMNGKLAGPQRRPVVATPLYENDNPTIQYRRDSIPRMESEQPLAMPAAPPLDRLKRRPAAADRIAYRAPAAEIVPYRVMQPQAFADAPLPTPVGEEVVPVAVEVTSSSGRSRRKVAAIAAPLILLGTAVVLAVNSWRNENAPLKSSVPPAPVAAPAVAAPVPPPTPVTDTKPAVAFALLGDGQSGFVGDTLKQPLMLQVENAAGRPVAGASVQFAITAGSGSIDPMVAVTDEAGIAQARWILNRTGDHAATATVAELSGKPVEFKAQAVGRPAAGIVAVSSTELQGTTGTTLGTPLVVRVVDDQDEPVAGVRVSFSVRSGNGRITPSSTATGRDGTARAEWTLGSASTQEAAASLNNVPSAQTIFRASARPASLAIRRSVSTGGTHTCLVNSDGGADCWGGNDKGQLGDGSATRRNEPVTVSAAEPFAMVSAGISHTCGVSVSSKVYCWGSNAAGQLGDGTRADRARPVRIASDEPMVAVTAGMSHSCGLDAAGRLYCWGQNANGQLGDGTRADRATPVRAGGGRSFRAVALGWAHTCALTAEGVAYCWGRNSSGELGDGGTADRSEPAAVTSGARFTALSAGSGHTCGLTSTGSVLCWGQNSYGQLGNEATVNSSVPVLVQPSDFFTAIAVGSVHSCALARDGSARCWGRNTYGQLGDGTVDNRSRPTVVIGGQRFSSLHASGAHTCGTAGGTSYCWGYNVEGQLGNGNRTNQTRPVAVNRQ